MINRSDELKNITPEDLLGFLEEHFTYEIPIGIESEIAMRKAGNMLGKLTNSYSYLASLLASLSVYTKELKQKCPNKPKGNDVWELAEYTDKKKAYEDMALRKSLVEQYLDIIRHQYNCISRMITVKIEADRELKMSDAR